MNDQYSTHKIQIAAHLTEQPHRIAQDAFHLFKFPHQQGLPHQGLSDQLSISKTPAAKALIRLVQYARVYTALPKCVTGNPRGYVLVSLSDLDPGLGGNRTDFSIEYHNTVLFEFGNKVGKATCLPQTAQTYLDRISCENCWESAPGP